MQIQLRHLALLALPTLINAVSLSDMTPRATGLSDTCNAVYTTQIYGCGPDDFKTQECSQSCIGALYGLGRAIQQACSNQGIEGQNLVVAFLADVGPQAICHNADTGHGGWTSTTASSTTKQSTHIKPSIISSTTTARKPTQTSSLLVDTSSTQTQTIVPHRTHKSQPTSQSSSSSSTVANTSGSGLAVDTSRTLSPNPTTRTSSAAGSSQTNLNDHSGGGSPFDTPGNLANSASSISLSLASMFLSAAAALFATFR